jgi:hypothetical protein
LGLRGAKKHEKWRRLHYEELYYLYAPPNMIREIKLRRMGRAGHVERMEESRGAYAVLVAKEHLEDKRRWEDHIKTGLREAERGEHGLAQSGSG